ncbi:response regulator NasT [Inhella inkyongensis]|uniref:Response regulator NasT n=1 Tax=Inhella inkyongensis TaxID=392593 RepID=A0A840RYR6_9BURK|nr:ANTAR domain-containing protein [Inhella inkyongensis]MBB5203115.1 response regulator NasT [Inhella inkyongensis]
MNPPAPPFLRVLLVDDGAHRVRLIAETLVRQGHEVLAVLDEATRIHEVVQRQRPDLVIVDAEAPGRDTLEHLATLHEEMPRPVLMFAECGAAPTVRAALRAGVSAYVVAGLQPERLEAVMQVACARFEQERALRDELAGVQLELAGRKQIERAKGLLMQEQGLSEDAAYRRLRRLAMDRSETLAAVAQRLIEAAQLLRS